MAPIGGTTAAWAKLTPDSTGSYINGTWTTLASGRDTRLYDASQVLKDGRVFVAGGEYGTGGSTGEVYNPLTNTWTALPAQPYGRFSDSGSMLLPDGRVLISPVSPSPGGYTTIFNPVTNTWSQGPKLFRGNSTDEQSFVKLPDDSILTIDGNTTSERYIPASNSWIDDAAVPVAMFDGLGEIGAGIRLIDGTVFFLGGTGHTARYTPSGTTSPGSWAAGPDIPGGLGTDDAPAAMLPDGKILFVAGPSGTYNGPTTFFIYDPDALPANAFTSVAGAPSIGNPQYTSRMLVLPDGTVLYTDGNSTPYVYNEGVPTRSELIPVLTSFSPNANGSITLTGTGINGISSGAAYGDDAQMDSNYPIVRLTSTGGSVYYARSYNWSSTGVATGATPQTVTFTLPLGIPAATYSLSVIANGAVSAPLSITVSTTAGNLAPTVATTAAAVSPVSTVGTNLTVLGADDAGESNLTYTWTTTASPSGSQLPSFSDNGDNTAKSVTANFHQAGNYTFKVFITDAGGLFATSTVSVTVNQTISGVTISPVKQTLVAGASQQFTAQTQDQFGLAMSGSYTWAVTSGGGTITTAGKYTAPPAGTPATVTVSNGAFSAVATVGVVSAPWISKDIGSPALTGLAYDNAGTFNVSGAGSDIFGTTDQFRYVYRNLTGDGAITARVASQQNTDPWAKSGVMIRNTLSAVDAMAFMAVTPGNGTTFQYRTASSASAISAGNTAGLNAPYWVRLVRVGDLLTGYRSSNGSTWIPQGSVNITMGATVYIGLEVTSHNTGALNTSTFDNVTVSQPTVAIAAGATPAAVTTTSTALSVLGADLAGESALTYTWAATTLPAGAAAPLFSANGTNASKNVSATFTQSGAYTFTCTLNDGILSTSSAVTVNVNSTLTTVAVSPSASTVRVGGTASFSASGFDQFGAALAVQPVFNWAVTGAGNAIDTAGNFTAGSVGGSFNVTATSGAVVGNATATVLQGSVVNRAIFYNNSFFDGTDAAANTLDDNAIAPDKSALLPGQTTTFTNYTSYDKGINGLMVDVANLPAGPITAADFGFQVSLDGTTWTAAPASASVLVRPTMGTGGSDRIEITFPDLAIRNLWLRITMSANANTGLASPDVFYFGNLVGCSGMHTNVGVVNNTDAIAARIKVNTAATIASVIDYNRSGQITNTDVITVRINNLHTLAYFTAPPPGPTAPSAPAAAAQSASVPVISVSPFSIIPILPTWMTEVAAKKKVLL